MEREYPPVQRRAPFSRGRFARFIGLMRAVLGFVKDKLLDDLAIIWMHGRLFVGLALLVTGLLSFSSDRYCDGNTSAYYACTRPATYYYYPWWAILCVLFGSFGIVLWYLRKKRR